MEKHLETTNIGMLLVREVETVGIIIASLTHYLQKLLPQGVNPLLLFFARTSG